MKTIDWHHAPLHKFIPGAVHIVTGATLHKAHLFCDFRRLKFLQDTLLEFFAVEKWIPHAWSCFSNHYHFIAQLPETTDPGLGIKRLHQRLGHGLNQLDQQSGRTVMYQYWDTCLSFENSYFARLNYVMNNPVKHGLVSDARQYPWCSAAWFAANNSSAFRRRIAAYKTDKLNEPDAFEVLNTAPIHRKSGN